MFGPLPLNGEQTWTVNGLSLAGLGDRDSVVTFVRKESKELWRILVNLQICENTNCSSYMRCEKARGVWISGPPGVGKSTELFGWGMFMAKRRDELRKNMLWVHQEAANLSKVVKVVNGVIYTTSINGSGLDWTMKILQLCDDCNLILLDAVREEMKSLIYRLYFNDKDSIIVTCTSYQGGSGYRSEEYFRLHHFNLNYTVFSWTMQDYEAAWNANPDIFNNISADELIKRFYYGGGSLRYMLQTNDDDIMAFLNKKLSDVSDYSILLRGMGGVSAPTAVNSLMNVRPNGVCGVISEYVAKKLAEKVDVSFISHAKTIFHNNPVCQGWIFELLFLQRIYFSYRNKQPCQLINENGTLTEFPVYAVREYSEDINLSIIDIEVGTMFIPTRWNQGCFDAVYYETYFEENLCRRKFTFFNATLAAQHDYKFQFIATFLSSIFDAPGMRQPAHQDIDVVMAVVTSSDAFSAHNTTRGDRSASYFVHTYDPKFQGNVTKYHISF